MLSKPTLPCRIIGVNGAYAFSRSLRWRIRRTRAEDELFPRRLVRREAQPEDSVPVITGGSPAIRMLGIGP